MNQVLYTSGEGWHVRFIIFLNLQMNSKWKCDVSLYMRLPHFKSSFQSTQQHLEANICQGMFVSCDRDSSHLDILCVIDTSRILLNNKYK